jgi:hypothetical protein
MGFGFEASLGALQYGNRRRTYACDRTWGRNGWAIAGAMTLVLGRSTFYCFFGILGTGRRLIVAYPTATSRSAERDCRKTERRYLPAETRCPDAANASTDWHGPSIGLRDFPIGIDDRCAGRHQACGQRVGISAVTDISMPNFPCPGIGSVACNGLERLARGGLALAIVRWAGS